MDACANSSYKMVSLRPGSDEKIARFAVYPELRIKAASLPNINASFRSTSSARGEFPDNNLEPVEPFNLSLLFWQRW